MAKDKATGWRIPLLFCAVACCAALLGALLKSRAPEAPSLPLELERQAQGRKIDLGDPEGSALREAISSAAGGFLDQSVKDSKLSGLLRKSLEAGRLDAACVALALIRGEQARADGAWAITSEAVKNCGALPWAVFAYKAIQNPEQLERLRAPMLEKWGQCVHKPN